MECFEGEIHFRRGDGERRHEDDGVEDVAGDETVGFGRVDNLAAMPVLQLDAGDEAALAGFQNMWVGVAEGFQVSAEMGNFFGKVMQGAVCLENAERCECGGAADGVGGVTMPVVEGVFRGAEEGNVDGRSREGGGEREGAAGEAFGEAEEIRDDVFLLAGEHGAGSPEACHDFVEDEVDVVPGAPGAEFRKHSSGPGFHFIYTLDEGLDDDCGEGFGR